jgi:diguanylate cyclase
MHGHLRQATPPLLVGHDPSIRPLTYSLTGLMQATPALLDTATCLEALERFHADPDIWAIPVVDGEQRPLAHIDRYVFLEFLSRLYARDLFGRYTLSRILAERPRAIGLGNSLIVEESASLDDVAGIIMSEGMQHMVSGFIVTRNGVYAGIVSGHALFEQIALRRQQDLYLLAHFDSLTRIPNRMLFTDRLKQAMREAMRTGTSLGLMFIDVDRFKQINDSLGHRFGDELLVGVARRLQVCIRDCDTLARLGGDEFALLMDGIKSPQDTDILARRCLESMSKPFVIMDREIKVTLSIGAAIFPDDDDNEDALLSKADAAMYEVKLNGRNGYQRFSPFISSYSTDLISLESDLKHALDHNEFTLWYQPQIDLGTNHVIGVEALLRWQHPTRGLLTPGSFIHIAEQSGMIIPIGEWVLTEACTQQRTWRDAGLPPMRMAINISPLQFRQAGFAQQVQKLLQDTCVDAALLELELTEGMVMCTEPHVLQTLQTLQALGVHLSLDDFGTGFSSLGYLRRFPIDRLKIDQSFVRNADQVPVNMSIIQAIVALARSLSLKVVAEGVESEAELQVVRDSGCDECQGYFYARPMEPEALQAWLEHQSR